MTYFFSKRIATVRSDTVLVGSAGVELQSTTSKALSAMTSIATGTIASTVGWDSQTIELGIWLLGMPLIS